MQGGYTMEAVLEAEDLLEAPVQTVPKALLVPLEYLARLPIIQMIGDMKMIAGNAMAVMENH